ncbi:hypothetical protein PK28_13530 [Hymenobacter sp. DG25B]|uniref:hypothetical protein n=1 Tax=Hymenobacter sp. DG25B TaxID=1385664 RepID=UPI00054085CC|nr:hypothetical protein [Hymenobacter sp. DG25B]AIZ64438.1 hypothetical protein PK28_13530 [Hymenobacter sp. DG25B]
MNLTKKEHLSSLRQSIREAKATGDNAQLNALTQVLSFWKEKSSVLQLAALLTPLYDRVIHFFVADAFAHAKDATVVPLLLAAARAPENINYRATFIWPCIKYDCTEYLDFFIDFLLQYDDPDEATLACVYVIKAMKGPFEPKQVKASITALLQRNSNLTTHDLALQDEVFTVQAAYALLDKYFAQIDSKWKDS